MPTVSVGLFRWLFRRGATLEDFADRLNHVWTFGLLLLLACIVSWRHHAESPIHCFPPAHLNEKQVDYMDGHCWNSHLIAYSSATNTGPVPEKDDDQDDYSKPHLHFTDDGLSDKLGNVTLYQWLPLIFCFQALLFKLPAILMYILHGYSGISFEKISSLTEGYSNLNMADRQLLGRQNGRYIYNWCLQFKCLPWRLLTMVWLLVKVLFVVNVIVQLVIFNGYLYRTNKLMNITTSYGDVITDDILENNATLWRYALVFPREVYCRVSLRQLARRTHMYTLHCDLPANEFNETVCMFLWVWFAFVAVVTCGSLATWCLKTLLPFGRKSFISKALFQSDDINRNLIADHNLDAFSSLVGEDGVMALKLIGSNSSDHVVRDVVCSMWNMNMSEVRGKVYQPLEDSRL